MNQHATPVSAIEDAIRTMLLPGTGEIEEAKAEASIVCLLNVFAISAEEFKHYCERVRRIAERRKGAAA